MNINFEKTVVYRVRWCAALLLAMGAVLPARAGVAIEGALDASRITMAETVTYTVTVSWDQDEGDYVFTWPEPPRSTRLEVTGTAASSGRTVTDGKTRAVRTFAYTLAPLNTGTAVIEPSAVTYRAPDGSGTTLRTRTVQVTIDPAPGEFPVMPVVWTVLVLAIAGSGAWLAVVLHRRKQQRTAAAAEAAAPVRSPREIAEEAVAGLEHLLMEGETKEYCTGVVKAARSFVEARYGLAFGNALSADIIRTAADADVPPEAVDAFRRILETGDSLKFSTAYPSREQLDRLKKHMQELLRTDNAREQSS